ncbi:hypothetical protein CMUST_15695 (plasmid) [Corynebacterium mustelae]|uniref:Uncharacterized protein n=2 Tax=Corynebacterium mustelae TaxID=571915 RepID=A0A0G3H2D5_9CORY|nr:hypothetical protein CMUST_04525 [Corynebacterium mustelae]AKK07427.1 hypothetical protein CMUST_15695 [Corynebacterium mustelae]
MTLTDWLNHKRHRDQVAEDSGQWIGLFDDNCEPLFDCPEPMEATAPSTKNAPADGAFSFPIRSPRGVVHPIATELLSDRLGRTDAQGRLTVIPDRPLFIGFKRRGCPLVFFEVTHAVAEGEGEVPSTLQVNVVSLLNVFRRIPAMSAPTSWTGVWHTFERDWVGPADAAVTFKKPRDLQDIKLVTVADGVTIEGPADVAITRLVQESVTAAFKAMGVADDVIHVVPVNSPAPSSPHVLIRPTDQSLWETCGALAQSAGVLLSAHMTVPGEDSHPLDRSFAKPTLVVRAQQLEVQA